MSDILKDVSNSKTTYEVNVHAKVFFIVDDSTAQSYAETMSEIMNSESHTLISEESVSNQDGEFTKLVTYKVRRKK